MSELRSRRAVLLAGVAVGAVAVTRPAAASAGRTTALTGVTVIDATGAPPRDHMTVLVEGERIVGLGRGLAVPPGAEVLHLPGKYVIPGLIDAHVHSIPNERISPPLHLVNGVTAVREMGGTPLLREWRDRIDRGDLLGPRTVLASRIIDGAAGGGEPMPGFVEVATEEQARAAVRQAKREGADFVKVYTKLPADLHRAIADEARTQRLPFAGHCPDLVPLCTASATGQRSVEHLYGTWYDTSTREDELRARIAGRTYDPSDFLAWMRDTHRLEWDAAHSYSHRKAARVFDTLGRNRTRVVPTLTVYDVLDRPDDVVLTDERLKYVPASTVESWRWALENVVKAAHTPAEAAQRRELFDRRLTFVGELAAAGVPVVAGTDGGDLPFVLPGFGLHDELALLVRAGLTPMAALRSATERAADLLGVGRSLGTVEAGKLADLVVLDADPLADIRNTTGIHAVLSRGRVIDGARRVRLLAGIAAEAGVS